MNPQAEELNSIIRTKDPVVFELLSERGKNIFFPKKGILPQSAAAKGKNINATIGAAVEDDGSPMRLDSVCRNIKLDPSKIFPYAPSYGRPDLREKWKSLMINKNPPLAGKKISMPVVTNAMTHGLSMIAYLFLNAGDKLIVPDLFWGNYKLIFSNTYSAELDTFRLFDGNKMDIQAIRDKLLCGKPGKKVLLLNFPNNPSGYTPTEGEAREVVSLIKESADAGNHILVICDDAYFGLIYEDGIEKRSAFAYLADLHTNVLAVKVDGATKEDYVWGFRTGFLTYGIKDADEETYNALEAKTAGAIRGTISNASNLSQSLLLDAYACETYEKEKKEKYGILKKRYEQVRNTLEKNSQYREFFTPLPFNSGYFMCVKLSAGLDGEKIRRRLLDEYDTGIINISNIFRVAFSSVPEKKIPELFENMYKACR